jgi:hypothetical protein
MATADLKLVYGGGGSFTATFFSGVLSVPSPASGTLVTITPPIGKKVRLTALGMAAGFTEANISVTANGAPVVTALTLIGSPTATVGTFAVGQTSVTAGGGSPTFAAIDHIDSIGPIVISKTTGSTAQPVYYSYAFGD